MVCVDNVLQFFLNPLGGVLGALPPPGFVWLSGHNARPPKFTSEMFNGMVLLQEMPSRTNGGYHLPCEGFFAYLGAPQKPFDHADYVVSQHQLRRRADHGHIHVSNVVNKIQSCQSLGQN